MRRLLPIISLCLVAAGHCAAQSSSFPCPAAAAGTSAFVGVSPGSPTSARPITITAGVASRLPIGAAATLIGNTIIVQLSVLSATLPSPPYLCTETTAFGPLAPGAYTVDLYASEPSNHPW